MCAGGDTLRPGGSVVCAEQKAVTLCFPQEKVNGEKKAALGIALSLLALSALPAAGQITPVEEKGKRVFINADEPRRAKANRSALAAARRATLTSSGASGKNTSSSRPSPEKLERIVMDAAERHRIDPALVRAVITTESNWNPSAVSPKGAAGLMQLVPGTAERLGVKDRLNPHQNVDGGVRYLRALLERYDGDLNKALAAYNAGEQAVERARGVPRYPETRNYVRKVTDTYFQSDSGRLANWWIAPRSIRRTTDERGRVVYTND